MIPFRPANRVARYFTAMGKSEPKFDFEEAEGTKDDEPLSVLASNIQRRMVEKPISIDDLVNAINERKKIKEIKKHHIAYLRRIKANKPEDIRDASVISEVAAVLGCTIADLFKTETQPTTSVSEDDKEFVRMAQIALSGPKADFVREAIEMAYSAAIMSRRRST